MTDKIESMNLIALIRGDDLTNYQRALARSEFKRLEEALSEKDAEIERLKESNKLLLNANAKLLGAK